TIFALASGKGRAGVAVVRISGPRTKSVVEKICGDLPQPRRATLMTLRNPKDAGDIIDKALVLWFPGPDSLTGEDIAEFHMHGGRGVLNNLFEVLGTLEGLRVAEPGEYLRRAFELGKLELTQTEAVNDLVWAETEAQRKQALRQMQGVLGAIYEDWRARLLSALGKSEAEIDFSDEDLPEDLKEIAHASVRKIYEEIMKHLDDKGRGERIRDGFTIVLLGPPNSGKSSIINRLAKNDVAIVSDIPGTTRDLIEVRMDIAGYPVNIIDTAGLREVESEIEAEGVRRARRKADSADLRLHVFEASCWPDLPTDNVGKMEAGDIILLNKCDLDQPAIGARKKAKGLKAIAMSALTGEGVDDLLEVLERAVIGALEHCEAPGLTRARHRKALEECAGALDRFLKNLGDMSMRSEDLRLATRALGQITGRVDVEDMLDIIFADFCIGK
ncbi:MAG: tRNA uridine-5-carboxymethylaminomethyl(34) synthesis GTPase MnmE, partial [Proteobacteria bacterium]|nr:tRNA uridine-5-carboxymethylaminomethyl(34) synthesis GTPase MnmE [Pseudomonadota bacterium]